MKSYVIIYHLAGVRRWNVVMADSACLALHYLHIALRGLSFDIEAIMSEAEFNEHESHCGFGPTPRQPGRPFEIVP